MQLDKLLLDVVNLSYLKGSKFVPEHAKFIRGLIDCKIESIILPLLGDHALRESNNFLRLLKKFSEL